MKKKIDCEIKRLIIEISLLIIFVFIAFPIWNEYNDITLADVVNHYSKQVNDDIVVTNKIKRIYSETFGESVRELRNVLITSYKEESTDYGLYLTLDLTEDYTNLMYSDGETIYSFSDLLFDKTDRYYFKLAEGNISAKETDVVYYYIWSKNLKETNDIKLKFVVM